MFERVRTYIPTVILGFLIFYFGFHALTGDRGLLATHQRQDTLRLRHKQLADLQNYRADLEARVKLLNNHNLSADLLEERARSLLGFVRPGDYVIRIPADAEPSFGVAAQAGNANDKGSKGLRIEETSSTG